MALLGKLDVIKKHLDEQMFEIAFEYLKKVIDPKSQEHQRLLKYTNTMCCEKITLDNRNFALEQSYCSKESSACFFESHKNYIDVQFIIEGEEIVEIIDKQRLHVKLSYNEENDVTIYEDTALASSLVLQKGDIAIFFPDDAHMPCIQNNHISHVIKTVIKVKV